MRPAIYGYMRVVSSDETDDESKRVKQELAAYAQREGFTLDQMFTENIWCSESAFYVMLDALKCHEVKDIIVPSLWHFARLPGLQDAMRQHIEQETGARIWVVQGQRCGGEFGGPPASSVANRSSHVGITGPAPGSSER
ncbi:MULTISPECIES: recombinase family protein [unclassified Streptomyces]|uniref:recombinase family protein n=1 Tax=unclassified Streptomyces TaxID=2593676 RepID=UPI002E281A24|nr:recombinase family protein [Streptomyces sp. NBC_01429]